MRVAILSFFSGQHERGVETWASELSKFMGKDFKIEVIGSKVSGSILWHALKNIGKWASADIVVPTNGRLQVLFCRVVTWLTRRPLIVFGHAGQGADDKWNLLCSPSIFIVFSKSQKIWVEKFKLPWTKVILIPHAVDTEKFAPAIKKLKKRVVLCVAADISSKRVGLVREAVKKLPGFKFDGVGRGSDRTVDYDSMPGVYKSADVFCFTPQPWEAFGLVYLEAMASNLPVVTIDDPTRREIMGRAGILVKDPTNTLELAAAIQKAYETDWANKPRSQAEKFSWSTIRTEYVNLFNTFKGETLKGRRTI